MLLGETETAERVLEHLEKRLDESVRLRVARARVYLEQSKRDKALQTYRLLASDYPEEPFFRDQARTIIAANGAHAPDR